MAQHKVRVDPSTELSAEEQQRRLVRLRRTLAQVERDYASAVARGDHAAAAEAASDLEVAHTKIAATLLGHEWEYDTDQGKGGRS